MGLYSKLHRPVREEQRTLHSNEDTQCTIMSFTYVQGVISAVCDQDRMGYTETNVVEETRGCKM